MADQYLQVPADLTGKKVDTLEFTVNSQTVQRRRVQIAGAIDTASAVVDHVRAHKGDARKFWDKSNWQPMCGRCLSRKTAKSDGRWGR